jgi:hypothetical protein
MNRAERRRRGRVHEKEPVLVAGEGIVAAELGHRYEARPHAELPEKRPGQHRWIAAGSWVLSNDAVEKAHDPDTMKFLDNENLMTLSIGCWDCEQPLGEIKPGSHCPAEAP